MNVCVYCALTCMPSHARACVLLVRAHARARVSVFVEGRPRS